MKIKQTLTPLLLLFTLLTYSQFTAKLENVKYLTQTIPNCDAINLNSSIYHDISLDVKVERPYYSGDPNQYATGNLILAYWTGSAEIIITTYSISPSNWTISGGTTYVSKPKSFTLDSNNLDNQNSGQLYARYEASNGMKIESCVNNITKPKFILYPSSVTISCSSTGIPFTVSNENSSPGSLSYQWQVGGGWLYNGNAVSNFTTSTNTITLVPNSFPPSNVYVTPVLNGFAQPQKVATVSLAPFTTTSATINGNTSICEPSTSSVYSIANLPSGLTVTWSSSNTAVATVSSTTGSNTTVNKVSNGTFNLIARVTNSCGQFVDIPKSIRIGGLPNFTINAVNVYGSYDLYIQAEDQGITSVTWTKISGNGQVGGNGLIGYAHGSPTSNWTVTARITATNDCGSTSITETYDGGGYGDACRKVTIIKDKNKKNYFIAKAPACRIGNSIIEENQEILNIKVYNIFGNFINEFKTENFDLSNAKKGIYIVNITTTNNVISSKVLVD